MLRRAQILSTLIELVGMVLIFAGVAMLPWAGRLVIGGAACLVLGWGLGVDKRGDTK